MKQFKAIFRKVNGKLGNTNPSGYNKFVELLEEGDDVIAIFKRKKDEKTNEQLRMGYALMILIKEHTGMTIAGLDAWAKQEMGLGFVEKIDGKEVYTCESKEDFSKEQMAEYINHLLDLCQKYQIHVDLQTLC